jgi:hypothetical protein
MLGLPRATEVNRRVAKEKLYANASVNTQLRDLIKEQIEAIVWRNKLAAGTFNVSGGEAVSEIQVFEVELRQRELDKRILPVIAKAITYKILFVLTFQGEAQAWMEVSGTFYGTEWKPQSDLVLSFNGLNLDAVYENLARQIAGGRLDSGENISEAVDRDKQRQRLDREIAALEKKLLREKQFNRQVEMNGELKRLRAELEGMSNAT